MTDKEIINDIKNIVTTKLNKHFNHCKYAKGCVNFCGIDLEVLLKEILKKCEGVPNDNKEPIIIDGINLDDVKKKLFKGQRLSITTATFEKIIENLEDLIMQLQRKTAECEEWKANQCTFNNCPNLGKYAQEIGRLTAQLQALRYKNIPKLAKHLQRKTAECEEWKKDVETWAYKAGLAEGKMFRYKQAIEEIKKLAKRVRDKDMKEKSVKKDYYDAMVYGFGALTEILDIINKTKEKEQTLEQIGEK